MHTATDTQTIITIAREFKFKAIVMMIDDSSFGPELILIKCCSTIQMRSNTSSDPTRGRRFKEALYVLQFFLLLNDIPASAFRSVAIFDQADVMKDCLRQKSNAVTATSQEIQRTTAKYYCRKVGVVE